MWKTEKLPNVRRTPYMIPTSKLCYKDDSYSRIPGSHQPIILQSKLLKLSDVVKYQTAIIMFEAKHHFLCEYIQKLFGNGMGVVNLL